MNQDVLPELPPIAPAPLPEQPRRNNTWLIVAIVLILLCCCCVIIGAAVVYTNYDKWGDPLHIYGALPALVAALAL